MPYKDPIKKEAYKERKKELNRIYYQQNREKILEQKRNYDAQNKEKDKEYYNQNKEEINKRNNDYKKRRKETDPFYKFQETTRANLKRSIRTKGYGKKTKTQEVLGCSYSELIIHLENQFEDWMTWDNYGLYNGQQNYGWDIDHIKPLSSAQNEEELITLFNHANLQPLCSYVNRVTKREKSL